ncbi:MAG: folate family ECF transporter S component [Clostridia bacterium]|nr:folate family ECF transporter S component [Clostridia bacterium]
MRNKSTQMIVMLGVLSALGILLRYVSFPPSGTTRFELSSIPIAVAAQMYGPLAGALSALVTDLLGTIMSSQTPFPPITVCKVLTGAVFGIFLWKKQTFKRIVLCMLTVFIVIDILAMGWVLSGLYGTPLIETMLARVPLYILCTALRIAVITILNRYLGGIINSYNSK